MFADSEAVEPKCEAANEAKMKRILKLKIV